jgi:hypothetical protein
MTTRWNTALGLAAALLLAACEAPEVQRDALAPGDLPDAVVAQAPSTPAPFVPGIVPLDGEAQAAAPGPEGRVVYMAAAVGEDGLTRINSSTWDEEAASYDRPTPLHFSDGEYLEESPALAPDGSYLLFASARPVETGEVFDFNIWVAQWEEIPDEDGEVEGAWSDPWPLPVVNSPAWDGAPSLAANGNLYFASERQGPAAGPTLFVSELDQGMWGVPEPLPEPLNVGAADTDPWIAPDESLLLFSSNRDGVFDIYVAFRSEVGGWLEAVPLGDAVNTDGNERAPAMSGSGDYLFFRRDGEGMLWLPVEEAGIEIPAEVQDEAPDGAP